MTNNDVDGAKVCLPIILLQKNAKNATKKTNKKKHVDGLHLQVNILHKK